MTKNYTPLDIKKLHRRRILKKVINLSLLFSSLVFVFSLVIFFSRQYLFETSQRTEAANQMSSASPIRVRKLEELRFVPRRIGEINVDKEKIYDYYKSKFPSLSEEELIEVINKKIFSYLVLTQERRPNLLIFNGDQFEATLNSLLDNHQNNLRKITFYYYKVRFINVPQDNLRSLGIDQGNSEKEKILRKLAEEKINFYQRSNLSPEQLKEQINKDQQISLLNNDELASERVENYDHRSPLFDDPDLYDIISSEEINRYTKIYPLRTKNPQSNQLEEYSFVFFYIEKRERTNKPLEMIINEYLLNKDII
ncbi:MAG: hypothetical protein NZL96_02750 [Patescibacteria group bacterium]|nr:hypothetical protein [Patescibacteria group bacterium]